MPRINHWAVSDGDNRYEIVVEVAPGDWKVAGVLAVSDGHDGHPTVYTASDGRRFTGSDNADTVIRHVCSTSADLVVRKLTR